MTKIISLKGITKKGKEHIMTGGVEWEVLIELPERYLLKSPKNNGSRWVDKKHDPHFAITGRKTMPQIRTGDGQI